MRMETVLIEVLLLVLLDDCNMCEDASDIYIPKTSYWTSTPRLAGGIPSSSSMPKD